MTTHLLIVFLLPESRHVPFPRPPFSVLISLAFIGVHAAHQCDKSCRLSHNSISCIFVQQEFISTIPNHLSHHPHRDRHTDRNEWIAPGHVFHVPPKASFFVLPFGEFLELLLLFLFVGLGFLWRRELRRHSSFFLLSQRNLLSELAVFFYFATKLFFFKSIFFYSNEQRY